MPQKGMRPIIFTWLLLLIACSDEKSDTVTNRKEEAVQLHPDFPIVEGQYQMTKDWSVVLPSKFNRRLEDGDLVIWKPGFTIWANVWNNNKSESPEARLASIKSGSSLDAFDSVVESTDGFLRYSYRLKEEGGDDRQAAFYCFAFGENGHVSLAIYFDTDADLSEANAIWRSLTETEG